MTADNIRKPLAAGAAAVPDEMPQFLRDLPPERLVTLDVRPILEAGQEPFQAIMQGIDGLPGTSVFKLIAPFEPIPLYAVLGRKRFDHWSRRAGDGGDAAWEIFFFREDEEVPAEAPEEESFAVDETEAGIVDIDVRGLEPPEPLERVMEAAEALSYGDILRMRHHREPLILFDLLAERGFAYRSEHLAADEWEIRIWRKS